ncbi:hypothetical protein PsorP6_002522 [Peronosclerospora sorghi]|uniref:Uncharacterized protein n=1 Tax=Peronosclerospora sorghi TaxID=230839 RepID=A0ACC0WYG7_9STRA|nr:hypothetical protein PsorP6_002522 [Peronosclerospora sorghi]
MYVPSSFSFTSACAALGMLSPVGTRSEENKVVSSDVQEKCSPWKRRRYSQKFHAKGCQLLWSVQPQCRLAHLEWCRGSGEQQ